MKQFHFYLFLISFLVIGCKKKDVEEEKPQVIAPCVLAENKLKIKNGDTLNTFDLINRQIDNSQVYYTWAFKAFTNETDFISILFKSEPDITKKYIGVSNLTVLENNQVHVSYNQSSPSNQYVGTGDVYVNYDNDIYTITSCNYKFKLASESEPLVEQSFKIIF